MLKDNTKIELYMYMTNEEFEQYAWPAINLLTGIISQDIKNITIIGL